MIKITGTKPKNHLRTLKFENRLQRPAFLHWEFKINIQEYLKPVPLADFIIRDGYPDPKGRTVVDNKAETEVRITFDNGKQSILPKVTDFGGKCPTRQLNRLMRLYNGYFRFTSDTFNYIDLTQTNR